MELRIQKMHGNFTVKMQWNSVYFIKNSVFRSKSKTTSMDTLDPSASKMGNFEAIKSLYRLKYAYCL